MYRRPSTLLMVTAAAVAVMTVAAGCEAKVYGTPPPSGGPQLTVVAPLGSMAPLPEAPPDEPAAAFSGLDTRERQATTDAAKSGAEITVAVLDRNTGQLVTNGNSATIAIASVVKLFIADDLLLQVSKGQTQLSPDDRHTFDVMLRSSDDSAAETFWNRSGGSAIINRVVARYGLSSTHAPNNGRWFNTISTVTDLVRYYDMMLGGQRWACRRSRPASSCPTWRRRRRRARRDGARRRLPAAVRHPRRPVRRTRRSQTGLDVLRSAPTGCTCPPA